MTVKKIHVIGIGYKPLDERSREVLLSSDAVLASNRLFDVFKRYGEYEAVKEKVLVINKVGETLAFIRENLRGKAIVLLASGDPMFFGIGRRVIEQCGADNVEIVPDLSSIQAAFSRIKVSWSDAILMSLHGEQSPGKGARQYEMDDLPVLVRDRGKIAILTDDKSNPAVISRQLLAHPDLPPVKMFVCEKLGYGPDERVVEGTPAAFADRTFEDPNIVILVTEAGQGRDSDSEEAVSDGPTPECGDAGPLFGLSEHGIAHSEGLITKDEIRAVSIHKLKLPSEGVLWDIGAGSGSVSLEAGRVAPLVRVYAVEKDAGQIRHLGENRKRFGAAHMTVVEGEAPHALTDLPRPDRVFIGGSGGKLPGIIEAVSEKMGAGVIVVNAVTLETVNKAIPLLEEKGFTVGMSQVSVTRMSVTSGGRIMSALNPVFIISGERR